MLEKRGWFKKWEAQNFVERIDIMKDVITIIYSKYINQVHQQIQDACKNIGTNKRKTKDGMTTPYICTMHREWYDTAWEMKEATSGVFGWFHSMVQSMIYELEFDKIRERNRLIWLIGLVTYYQWQGEKVISIEKMLVIKIMRRYEAKQ